MFNLGNPDFVRVVVNVYYVRKAETMNENQWGLVSWSIVLIIESDTIDLAEGHNLSISYSIHHTNKLL
jgi:hypothetical protein